MSVKQWIALVLILIWIGQSSGLAGQNESRLAWSELGRIVVDRKAGITLPDGVRIEGEVLAVRPDALVLDIGKTSDRKVHPRGQASIPRASVTELRLIKDRGPGKLIGGILGTVGGLIAASVMGYYGGAAGGLPGWFLVLPVAAAGGYYAGKAADRRVTRITIAPEPAETAREKALNAILIGP